MPGLLRKAGTHTPYLQYVLHMLRTYVVSQKARQVSEKCSHVGYDADRPRTMQALFFLSLSLWEAIFGFSHCNRTGGSDW